ncbi:MAG: DUF5916 domain-containing protein [Rhodothermales bacterium]
MSFPIRYALAAAALCLAGTAAAQVSEPFSIPRLQGPIELDGFSDEAAWEAVPPLPLTVYQPVHGAPPSQRTEIRVAYDDAYIYAAGRMYDSEPSGIRANSLYRDEYAGDDTFSLILDSFNDNENALWFSTTPAGVRFDWAVANDAQAQRDVRNTINRSWNTFWDVAVRQTDEGWFAEMRIPFSSLRFQDEDGHVVMGLSTYRYISRLNERHMYPDILPNWQLGWAKASVIQDVAFDGVYSQNPLYVTPYVLGGRGETALLNDEETAIDRSSGWNREAGVDLKYNLTSNLTMDLTLNTDFAQVEVDDEQVNLTRLSLFFPEKRQFFQERAGIFDFSTGRTDQLFYSRRIGLDDEGLPVRILGGGRVVGRVGPWDLGVLDMQTAVSDSLPAENFGVFRLRRQVLNGFSYAGGMMTSRLGNDGSYNLAFGLDAILRPFGNEYVTVRVAGTADSDLADAGGAFDLSRASMWRAQWERRTDDGFSYRLTGKRYGPEYFPEMGFITRENVQTIGSHLGYGWFGTAENWYRHVGSGLDVVTIMRNDDATIETFTVTAPVAIETQRGGRLTIGPQYSYEDLSEPLELPEDVEVPVGSYSFVGVEAMGRGSNGKLFRTENQFYLGTFYDGWRVDLGVGPRWSASKYVQLQTEYLINMVHFPDRDADFNTHIVRLKAQLALNTRASLSAFVQYSSASDLVTSNVRFRYNFSEGNDLWLVYNEGQNLDRERLIQEDRNRPMLPRYESRILLVKYTYTFRG